MNIFWRSYKAEFMKRKRSLFVWLHLIVPVVIVVLFTLLFFGRRGQLDGEHISTLLFEMVGLGFPLVISVLCGLITSQEEQAGHYQVMLGKTRIKIVSFLSQLTMLITMGIVAIIILLHCFFISMKGILNISNISYILFMEKGLLIFLSAIFLYCFSLVISYLFGIGTCSLIGFFGVIVAALSETTLGDKVWMYLPWSWPIRLGSDLTANLLVGQGQMIVLTSFILIISTYWFHYWNGTQFIE